MVVDPIMDVISVAMAVKRACDETCAAKKILAVVARNMDSLLAVITKVQIKLDELDSAVIGGILKELHAEITKTLKLATKARKMSRVVFVVKASGIREDVELSLKAVHLSLMTLGTARNEQIAAELRDFHGAWQTRQEDFREEAARERRDRDRLREGISRGGEDAARAAGVDAFRMDELERALTEIRLERDEIRAEVGATLDTVARDKAAAEAQLMDQIIAALESAEREEARPAQAQRPPDLLSGCNCPITGEVMTDPVSVDATCMHTVSREGLEAWFRRGEMVCPVCRTDLRSRHMAPNVPLRNVIENLLMANPSHTAGIVGNAEPSAPPAPSPLRRVAPPPPQEKRWKCGGVWGDYVGDLDTRERPHGHGVLKCDTGHVYEGEWRNGERDGRGMLRLTNGNVYEGEYRNGKFEGRGTYRYADGDVYEGEFKNGKRDGRGMLRLTNGDVYEGEWKDDKREGRGTFRYANGDIYEGEWKNGKRDGRGTYRHADGEVYEGELKNGKREGRGTCRYADGDVYEGEFKNSKREGRGTFRWSDGRAEVGQYKDDKDIGEGVRWSAVRKTAYRLMDGSVSGTISLEEAKRIADRVGLPVPV